MPFKTGIIKIVNSPQKLYADYKLGLNTGEKMACARTHYKTNAQTIESNLRKLELSQQSSQTFIETITTGHLVSWSLLLTYVFKLDECIL
jgi:hypothetical protein